MSWRRLQDVFSIAIFCLPRRIKKSCEYVFKTFSRRLGKSLQNIFKSSSRRLGRQEIITLKTSSKCPQDMAWRRFQEMSWRLLQDMSSRNLQDISCGPLTDVLETSKMFTGKESIFVSNKSKSVSDKYLLTNLYPTNLRRIQEALIRTQNSNIYRIFKLKKHFYFKVYNRRWLFGVVKPAE